MFGPSAGSDAITVKPNELSMVGYFITGQKMWISNAGFVDILTVFARIENDKNISAFIVENNPENGIELGNGESKLEYLFIHQTNLFQQD